MMSSHMTLLNCTGSGEHQGACGQFGEHYYIYHTKYLHLGELAAYGGSPEGVFHLSVIFHLERVH